jgi:hypothetical protein
MPGFPPFFPVAGDRYRGNLPQNWFFATDQEKGPILLGVPGNAKWINVGASIMQIRGMAVMGNYLYVVGQNTVTTCNVYQVDMYGKAILIGSLATGTGPLYMVPMANQMQLFISDGVNGYYYDTFPKFWTQSTTYLPGVVVQPNPPTLLYYQVTGNGGMSSTSPPAWPTTVGDTVTDGGVTWACIPGIPYFTQITDPNFLGGGPAVLQDNYLVYAQPNGNQWGVSNLGDCTTYDSMAQALKGDGIILAILSSHLNIWLMGDKTDEIWYNAGSSPFPFAKLLGTLIEKGVGAPLSATIGDNTVFWLDNYRQVQMAVGFQPKRISTDKVDRELEGYANVFDAIGFYQVQRGHNFYWLILPSANRTLVCDISMHPPLWHVRTSWPDDGRHRANCYCYFNNMHLVGADASGDILKLDPDNYTDNGQPLKAIIQSREFRASGKYIQFPDLQFLFNSGTAEIGLNPQALISLSRDGGRNFGTQRAESMGKVGENAKRTIFRQNGSDFQRIFELSVSDPVNRDLLECSWLE